nr:MAG TPA: hypothetical protein [Caudoviricetes sp.]
MKSFSFLIKSTQKPSGSIMSLNGFLICPRTA